MRFGIPLTGPDVARPLARDKRRPSSFRRAYPMTPEALQERRLSEEFTTLNEEASAWSLPSGHRAAPRAAEQRAVALRIGRPKALPAVREREVRVDVPRVERIENHSHETFETPGDLLRVVESPDVMVNLTSPTDSTREVRVDDRHTTSILERDGPEHIEIRETQSRATRELRERVSERVNTIETRLHTETSHHASEREVRVEESTTIERERELVRSETPHSRLERTPMGPAPREASTTIESAHVIERIREAHRQSQVKTLKLGTVRVQLTTPPAVDAPQPRPTPSEAPRMTSRAPFSVEFVDPWKSKF